MNRLRATNSVPLAQADTAPATGTPQYATDGNILGSPPVAPTQWPAYAYNMMQDELCTVIAGAGVPLDDTNWAQLFLAIRRLVPLITVSSHFMGQS